MHVIPIHSPVPGFPVSVTRLQTLRSGAQDHARRGACKGFERGNRWGDEEATSGVPQGPLVMMVMLMLS